MYVRLGMTPLQAIQTATVNEVESFRMVRQGADAPNRQVGGLIAVDGDALWGVTTLQHRKIREDGGGPVIKNGYRQVVDKSLRNCSIL